MTVSTTTNTVIYRGNGAATQFAVPFLVLDEDHLVVKRRVFATGEIDATYIGTDYSYSGIGDPAGTLTLDGAALSATYELTIERVVPYTQDLDIVNAGGFYPNTVEEQLDLLAMQIQQVADIAGRSVHAQAGNAQDAVVFTAGSYLAIDADGQVYMASGTGNDSSFRTDLAGISGSDLVGIGLTSLTNVLWTTAEEYGAVGDGITDDSVAIQAAIDAMTLLGGRAVVFQPGKNYRCNVTLADGVWLVSLMPSFGYLPSNVGACQMTAAGAGPVVDTPVGQTVNCGVQGINFTGLGAGTACIGVQFRNVDWGGVKQCSFNNFSDQGILQLDGQACVYEDILMTNVLLDRARAAKAGGLHLVFPTTDSYINRVECNCGLSAVTSVNLYCCGFYITAWQCFINAAAGEFSDVGIHITGSGNRVVNSRADLNAGHGWVNSGSNIFVACNGLNNSQDTTNTYDNFLNTSGNSSYSACQSGSTTAKVARYGFNDTQQSDTVKAIYDASCQSSGTGTGDWFIDFAGASRTTPKGPPKSFTSLDATPSVKSYGTFVTANAGATSITTFDDGVNGQEIDLICADANTTLVHGATLTLLTGASRKLTNGSVTKFVKQNTVWREVGLRPLKATAVVDPANLATAASTAIATVACTGAVLGNMVRASFSLDLAGADITAWVSAADTVSYFFTNVNGTNPLDLASGTLTVHVYPQ